MSSSILTDTKKALGLADDYTVFDDVVTMHINAVFEILDELGIGPSGGFVIEDKETTWEDYLGNDNRTHPAKTYIYLRVRLLFDPPQLSFVIESMERQYKELEWRLNVARENEVHPELVPFEDLEVVDGGAP